MADEPEKRHGWWSTLPGILTAAAAVITAATGLIAILSQTGVFGEKSKAFVSQKAADVRDAVTAPPPSKAEPGRTPAPSASQDGPASGIASAPLRAAPFTGAVVTLLDGTVVRLRDDVKEYCQGRPVLRTLTGQYIEWPRIRRFDVTDWNKDAQKGSVRITLNNGEALDVRVEGCAMVGTNDLGEYRGAFDGIRSVEFVRP